MTYWILPNLGTIAIIESHTEEGVIIVDVRDLHDAETDVQKVKTKIEVITGLLTIGCRVAVRCVGGLNRSNTLALAAMCYLYPPYDVSLEERWNHHYAIVRKKCPRAWMNPDLIRTCKQALRELRHGKI